MTRAPLLALLFALATATSAAADGCVPTTSAPEISAPGVFGNTIYVDNDLCQLPPDGSLDPLDILDWHSGGGYNGEPGGGGCLFSIWTYEESNGIDGLQRGDEVVDDTCGGVIESDTLAFY